MQKPSKKHHYLPRHYLEGFTDEQGGFFVYDKHQDRIFPSAPGDTFFETNLNTMTLPSGKQSRALEDAYTFVESMSWPTFDQIRDSTAMTAVPYSDRLGLFLFLHWRLPGNAKYAEQLADQAFRGEGTPFDYFLIRREDGAPAPQASLDALRSSSAFKKSMRILAPFAPFFKDEKWEEDVVNWRFLYSGGTNGWYMVGDNPIVALGQSDHDPMRCLNEFIFPVSGSILLVNIKPPITQGFPPEFVVRYNGALIQRAQRFVASRNEEFLRNLVQYYMMHAVHERQGEMIPNLFASMHGS